jgi:predicted Zn-dependent protease
MALFMGRTRAVAVALAVWIALCVAIAPARAQTFIRDAEIEETLRRMMAPLEQAAGVPEGSVNVFIIQSKQLNAFVAGGANIFLNTGLLQRLKTPEALMAVMAHELGHLTGGHQSRLRANLRNAQGPAALIFLLAIAAAAAGGGEAGLAIASAGQSALTRNFLSYTRSEEASADQAGVVYLERAGVDPAGMIDVLDIFRGQEILSAGAIDAYAQTHPLSSQRMALVEQRVASSRNRGKRVDPELIYWHGRMRAKLDGFLGNAERTLIALEASDPGAQGEELALYRKAVALHRLPDLRGALATIDQLLALRPKDPFYHELKGQILYESARAKESVAPYRRAVELAPDEPLIRAGLGAALLALETPSANAEALEILKGAALREQADPSLLRALALAHARAGNEGQAALATAERMAIAGRTRDALRHARRAVDQLPRGSPGWLRADDILNTMNTEKN